MSDVNEARRDRYAPFIGSLRLTSVPIHLSRLHASVRLMSCSAPYVHLTFHSSHRAVGEEEGTVETDDETDETGKDDRKEPITSHLTHLTTLSPPPRVTSRSEASGPERDTEEVIR